MTESDIHAKRIYELIEEQLTEKILFWQRTKEDPYNIGNAVQVALLEVRTAIHTAINQADKEAEDFDKEIKELIVGLIGKKK
jgi:hypothetical protein